MTRLLPFERVVAPSLACVSQVVCDHQPLLIESHHAQLSFERNSGHLKNSQRDLIDQLTYVISATIGISLNEVCMFGRDLSATKAMALQSHRLDETTR